MNRVSVFLRSVLPQDLTQLLLLLGVTCLFIAPHLRWGPGGSFSTQIKVLLLFALYAIHFAGTFGFLVCFRPGSHPVRHILWWVGLPAVTGECALIYSCSAYLTMSRASASPGIPLRNIGTLEVLSKLGPGFHYAVAGLVLVAVFTTRLALGFASLPLALPKSSVSMSDNLTSWNRVQSFLWVLLALLPLILWFWFPPVMNFILGYFIFSHLPVVKGIDIVTLSANAATDLIIAVIAIRMIGKEAWGALRRSLRWPTTEGLSLAVAFPVGIAALISVGQFLLELFRWAAHLSDRLGAPEFGSYFTLPNIGLFSLLFLAFTEEIIFRGVLQPLFIRRYGPVRGIFLVGMTFAAAHFSTDFSAGYTDALVILKVCLRLIISLALSFVVGWLTLRSGSVLPAAIAHGLANVLGSSPFAPAFAGIGPLTDLLWAVLAYVLFRYWPVQTETTQEIANTTPLP